MSFDYQIFFMDGMTVNEVITENEDFLSKLQKCFSDIFEP